MLKLLEKKNLAFHGKNENIYQEGNGILRLYQRTPDFIPNIQKQTHIQCWIRIFDLPQEYWRPKILYEIAGVLGTPISLDENNRNRSLGHFARVLVDIALSGNLLSEIMVERDSFAFFVSFEYERLPAFCSFCKAIGHEVSGCKKKNGDVIKPINDRQSLPKERQVYVPKHRTDMINDLNDVQIQVPNPIQIDPLNLDREADNNQALKELSLNEQTVQTRQNPANILPDSVPHVLEQIVQDV